MILNSKFSIVIPTYNRAKFLDSCLESVVHAVKEHGVAIYVSDNFSFDNTKDIVDKWRSYYPHIIYKKNTENLGPDKNFELALCMPQTEYVWLLGDTYKVQSDIVSFLMNELIRKTEKPDAFVFNANNRVKGIGGCDYFDKNKLLADLGWHMTCMSSLVYKKNILQKANFNRYRGTDFIQTGILFEYIEDKDFSIKWVSEYSIFSIVLDGVKKIGWQDRTFDVWVNKWSNFIFSLPPSYTLNVKLACIKAHGRRSDLFSIKNLLYLRADGILNLEIFWRFRYLFPLVIYSWSTTIFAIALAPKFVATAIRGIIRRWLNLKQRNLR